MIDTGLLVVLTITFTMLLSVLILLSYDFEQWCPQVYSALFNSSSHCDKSAGGYNKDPIKWD